MIRAREDGKQLVLKINILTIPLRRTLAEIEGPIEGRIRAGGRDNKTPRLEQCTGKDTNALGGGPNISY